MRIGIDARLYNQTGVGRYISNLISHLGLLDQSNQYFVYLTKRDFSSFNLPNKNWKKKLLDIHWHTLLEQLVVAQILSADKLDVMHFPYFNVPVLYRGKYLLTIHDLIIDHFDTGQASTKPYVFYKAKRFGYKIVTTLGIRKAAHITAISQTTRKEIIDHYHVDPAKITVTYDAVDSCFRKITRTKKSMNYYQTPYLLYVGNAYPHKNLERLCQAFKIIHPRKKIKLVLVGEDDFFYSRLKNYVAEMGLKEKVIFFGKANNWELYNLYSNTECLVFPSLMEGFGLPNLETLLCGKMPVVSDIPVFREIWENKLFYFDPFSVEDMAKTVLKILDFSKSEYQQTVQQAKKIMNNFSWEKTAKQTLNLYEKIFHSK
jgi:glycosyltransferase involved in cell wall biosynthesis